MPAGRRNMSGCSLSCQAVPFPSVLRSAATFLAVAKRFVRARHQERLSNRDRRPTRSQGTLGCPDGGVALGIGQPAFCRSFLAAWKLCVSSVPPLAPVHRPPLAVASGCHNSPAASSDAWPDEDVAPSSSLADTFREEHDRLLRYMGRRAGYDAAPDLVQEVFARAVGSYQSIRLGNPAAFLTRIARNLLIDRSRRQKRDNVLLFPLEEGRDRPVPPSQSWNIEASDLLRVYEQAVDALPDKTRRVFLMHRVDELSYRQIHQALGISIATVEYHMIKALAQIARRVEASR